jgi:predicted DCC family thiol-disulfide oxidoreductase YuxK
MPRPAHSYRDDPDIPPFTDDQPILVFDGKCVLCSATVQFVLDHDRERRVRFIVAQSPLGAALYRHLGLKHEDYETNILLENGRALTKSESSIRLFELVGLPWSLMSVFRLLPPFIRDRGYEVIARNRLKWFGARETCYAPDAAERARFLG